MHSAAYEFVARTLRRIGRRRRVLELGSRDVNGSARSLFVETEEYVGVDWRDGPGVDVIADAGKWRPKKARQFDCVVSTECLEHAPDGAAICRTAQAALVAGGVFILTAAGPAREPHGVDGTPVGGEFYANVHPADLQAWLAPFGFWTIELGRGEQDIYAVAVAVKAFDPSGQL